MLCSRGRYLEGRGDAPRSENVRGVQVRRVSATSFGKRTSVGRLVDYLTFHLLAGVRTVSSCWADVVVTLTTPPLVGWMGAVAKLFSRSRHVNFVMDLHPDAEFAQGMIRIDSVTGRVLERIHAACLRRADANVVLGSYQRERITSRGVGPERIAEIPVWSDGREIEPVPHAENPLRERLGWSDRFVVMYSGNAGVVHRFDELLAAARELGSTDPRVLFAFVGGGPRTAEIRAFGEEHGLENMEFHDYFAREELRQSLSAADVHFMSLRPEHVGIAVPGKLYGILAAGRPALFAGPRSCESAETILAANAGEVFEPGQGEELAEAIRRLALDRAECAQLGARGRLYFEDHHERGLCVEAWREVLEAVAAGAPLPFEKMPAGFRARLDTVRGALPAERTTVEAEVD